MQQETILFENSLKIGTDKKTLPVFLELVIKEAKKEAESVEHKTLTKYKTISIAGTMSNSGGQIYDYITKENVNFILSDERIQRIVILWKEWHLNDCHAECMHQTSFDANDGDFEELAKKETAKCPKEYAYGSKWLVKEMPESIVQELMELFEGGRDRLQDKKSDSEIIAEEFLKKTGTSFNAVFLKYDRHFDDDKEKRDIYEITLTRGERVFKFNFGNSVVDSVKYKITGIVREKTGIAGVNTKEELKILQNKYRAEYGQFWNENQSFKAPTPYDVLACLQKNDVGSFEDFCSEFGYDTDSRKAEKSYKAVVNEYNNLKMLYNDAELEMIGEMQ